MGMIAAIIVLFLVFNVLAASQGPDVHVQDAYPAISFFAACVVAVLGFLLKWLVTRDRASVDARIDDLHKHFDEKSRETKGFIDGLGIKVERLADTIEENISRNVEELRRHDRDLFTKWDQLNRELGTLRGEHDAMKGMHERNHPP